jgi:asparagine synthase (glutamine-hydrolysing)
MCGILGFWQRNHQPIDLAVIQKAAGTIFHRGPDDEGYLLFNLSNERVVSCGGSSSDARLELNSIEQYFDQAFDVAFGFRRLSILDLSTRGHQPMSSADARYQIVYNGEIYNYLELRRELSGLGHDFHSASDTEVLLAAWEEWGPECLSRLVGMFAFALLDVKESALYLVRDFFGIKPLYYAWTPDGLAFASEIPSILEFSGVSRRVNPEKLYQYLRFGITDDGETTLFADIFQVPPAHFLRLNLRSTDEFTRTRYWGIELKKPMKIAFLDAADKLRELFLDSVRLHLRSDVPLGTALSGGIDSSSIVCAIRYLEPDAALHAFSFIAEDTGVSEEQFVDIAVEASGAIVHKVHISVDDLVSDLDYLIRVQGEPFGSTSIYAQHRIFRLAKDHGVKVMLDGQGADELLGGYVPYAGARFASLVMKGKLPTALRFLRAVSALPGRKRVWMHGVYWLLPKFLSSLLRSAAGDVLMPSWLNKRWFTQRGVRPRFPHLRHRGEYLRGELLSMLTSTNLPMLLRYEDRNSMAYSVESRVPFLTPALVEFILSLPEDYLIANDGTSKAIFREAMRGIVPDDILTRQDKIGFATPESDWLKALRPWIEEQFGESSVAGIPVLSFRQVHKEWQRIIEGNRPFSFQVWRWVNLIVWARAFGVDFTS